MDLSTGLLIFGAGFVTAIAVIEWDERRDRLTRELMRVMQGFPREPKRRVKS